MDSRLISLYFYVGISFKGRDFKAFSGEIKATIDPIVTS